MMSELSWTVLHFTYNKRHTYIQVRTEILIMEQRNVSTFHTVLVTEETAALLVIYVHLIFTHGTACICRSCISGVAVRNDYTFHSRSTQKPTYVVLCAPLY
jgi:hypothetical protein